ncbi:MAG: hypothetical protein EHM13_14575 [Acidobacteria bacterium]|nr:MAG: hypothetical protein EHM13_14575 [Acidobacteriota bacterium]
MQAKRTLTLGGRLVLVVLAAASLTACDVVVSSMNMSGKAQESWSRTYPIAPNGRIELSNTNGLVEVLATNGQQIEVRAERIARANTDEAAREVLKELQIKEDVTGDVVRLETVLPKAGGMRRGGEVRYYLKVPATVSVKVHNTNGQVRVDGVTGAVVAETTNGGVRGVNLGGDVEASTTNGGVELEVRDLARNGVKADTTNGGITLFVPENVKAQFRATTRNGGISLSGLTVDGENGRNLVEGTINGGGPRISLGTTNGGIRVRAGSSAK